MLNDEGILVSKLIHFHLVAGRGSGVISAVTTNQAKARKIWAEEKASARNDKPSRIWVRPGLPKKRF